MRTYFLTIVKIISFFFIMWNVILVGTGMFVFFIAWDGDKVAQFIGWFALAFSVFIFPVFNKVIDWCKTVL